MAVSINEKKASEAKIAYNTLCSALDNNKLSYKKDEKDMSVQLSIVGNGLTMFFYVKIDASRSVVFLKSPMPFKFTNETSTDMIRAVSAANWSMLNGMFEINAETGYVGFKVVAPFMESLIGERLFKYLIDISFRMVNLFGGKLADVASGKMSIEDFERFAAESNK